MKKYTLFIITLLVVWLLIGLSAALHSKDLSKDFEDALQENRVLFEDRCNECHDADEIYESDATTREEWEEIVSDMDWKWLGALLSDEEEVMVVDYIMYVLHL